MYVAETAASRIGLEWWVPGRACVEDEQTAVVGELAGSDAPVGSEAVATELGDAGVVDDVAVAVVAAVGYAVEDVGGVEVVARVAGVFELEDALADESAAAHVAAAAAAAAAVVVGSAVGHVVAVVVAHAVVVVVFVATAEGPDEAEHVVEAEHVAEAGRVAAAVAEPGLGLGLGLGLVVERASGHVVAVVAGAGTVATAA